MKKLLLMLALVPALAFGQTNTPNILDNTSATISGGTINNTVIGGATPAAGTFTTVNKVTITQPATAATLTILNNKTATINKTLTFDGTDSTTMTFPATSATIARTDAANTFTGVQTMTSPVLTTPTIGAALGTSLVNGYTSIVSTAAVAVNPVIENHGTSNSASSIGLFNWSSVVARTPAVQFARSNSNTIGTNGVVGGSGSSLGAVSFAGDDGAAFIEGARIEGLVDGTPGSNDMPGRIDFLTTPDGSATSLLTMRLNNAGAVLMPRLASSSAATTGTVCWTTGTGLLNVDTTTTCLLSSLKYKEAITGLEEGSLKTIMALRPVSYNLKKDANPTGLGRQVGFIAEELAKLDDRFVGMDEDGNPHAVRYQQMVALLTKAMQEQQVMIKSLRHDLQTLRARVARLNK